MEKDYRILKIKEIHKQIQNERDKRNLLGKRLKKVVLFTSIFENLCKFATAASAGLGIPALLGGISVPIGISLEGLAIVLIATTSISAALTKRFNTNIKRHEMIRVLADLKLNKVDEAFSKAIDDGKISHLDLESLLNIYTSFQEEKQKIKEKVKTNGNLVIDSKEFTEHLEKVKSENKD